METEIKNYGLILPNKIETREEGAEHLLGSLGKPIINETGDWTQYLPDREPQNIRKVEAQACTAYGSLNAIETLLKFKGFNVNYSDRYLAIIAGIDPYRGADPHTTIETIRRKSGCIPEERLPFSDDIKTPEDYYDISEVTKTQLLAEGQQWYDQWELNHEYVFLGGDVKTKYQLLQDALRRGTVCVSVAAWYQNDNGLYFKPQGARDNHWTMLTCIKDGVADVFDSYDNYTKSLVKDYDFAIAKVFYLTPAQPKLSIFQKILDIISKILMLDNQIINQDKKMIPSVTPVVPLVDVQPVTPPPPIETLPNKPIKEDLTKEFCLAIQEFEGYFEGSHSYRNHSPGNFRWTPYVRDYLHAIGQDSGGYATFSSYEKGFIALETFVRNVAKGMVKGYKKPCPTIKQFTSVYAPTGDNNNPDKYANYIAKKIGKTVDTLLTDFIT